MTEERGLPARRSLRLRNFDYAGNATYFVTLCTRDRVCLFGEVENGLVVLNEIGTIVEQEWMRSALMRAELELHSFVVMPNHLHGLLTITPMDEGPVTGGGINEDAGQARKSETGARNSETGARRAPLRRLPRSLGAFVAGYKSATYREIAKIRRTEESIWQRGFYEHVVRDERDFNRIVEYMANNPFNWHRDREFVSPEESHG